ncbi:type IX secretion system membrane protein PorP/SprF [Paludibacter sp. 221]|uniref:PorP/SprF family type IX secretion system membrane protein n=1 Tax=Paludibacter sp. 221 TaxID=2302939 RepID=UPI0013D4B40C|nr:PorP/SprF family type IX secretion system membrane protein [Paludibacter sp. 221]NDV46344.1 type IX secretion system membrane protein PorP/SprF [Paludibacter sp. 221]
MKKVVFCSLLLLFYLGKIAAQSDSQMSQYTFFPAAFNPAMAGENDMIQAVVFFRQDFWSFDNGALTLNAGANMPFSIGKSSHGAGIRFVIKEVGSMWRYQNAYLQYAYKHTSSIGKFSAGLDIGFIDSGIDGAKAEPKPPSAEDESHSDNDQTIPQAKVSGMQLDLNAGVMYKFTNGFAGISCTHITAPKIYIGEDIVEPIKPALHVIGGYQFKIPDTKLVIKPSTYLKTDFVTLDWDLTGRLEYDERIWGGLSYRIGNSVGVHVGMNIFGGLTAGVAYDVPLSNTFVTFGGYEIFLEYNFEFLLGKHTKKYKSIRIL